jgi:hypothetical protein
MTSNYAENLKANASFDLRNTAYDVDGYMLVSTVELKQDPTIAGFGAGLTSGYIYTCIANSVGKGFTCAYTYGTAAEMALNTKIGTVETTTLTTFADFNKVITGST